MKYASTWKFISSLARALHTLNVSDLTEAWHVQTIQWLVFYWCFFIPHPSWMSPILKNTCSCDIYSMPSFWKHDLHFNLWHACPLLAPPLHFSERSQPLLMELWQSWRTTVNKILFFLLLLFWSTLRLHVPAGPESKGGSWEAFKLCQSKRFTVRVFGPHPGWLKSQLSHCVIWSSILHVVLVDVLP